MEGLAGRATRGADPRTLGGDPKTPTSLGPVMGGVPRTPVVRLTRMGFQEPREGTWEPLCPGPIMDGVPRALGGVPFALHSSLFACLRMPVPLDTLVLVSNNQGMGL